MLNPTEGSVPPAGGSAPGPPSPGEAADGKIHLPGARGNAPRAVVYTKAPLKGSAPLQRGLAKGFYRGQQEPPSGCVPAPISSGIHLALVFSPLGTGSVHVRVPPLPGVPLLPNHSHEQGVHGLDRGRSSGPPWGKGSWGVPGQVLQTKTANSPSIPRGVHVT